jgi:hypothetical protein
MDERIALGCCRESGVYSISKQWWHCIGVGGRGHLSVFGIGYRHCRQPVRWPLARNGTRRPDRSKRTEFVCPSSTRPLSDGSVRCSTARQIVSKLIEFVCPSSTRHRSAGSVRRSTARQIVSKLIEFVCPSTTRPLSGSRRPSKLTEFVFPSSTCPLSLVLTCELLLGVLQSLIVSRTYGTLPLPEVLNRSCISIFGV